MLFFSAILLSLVQFAFLAYDPNDPCFYGVTYCLNRDGTTKCSATDVVKATFRAGHDDGAEHLSVSLSAYRTKGEGGYVSVGFNVGGKPYTLYCLSDGPETHISAADDPWAYDDYSCSWQLDVTVNSNQVAPVTNKSISIDLVTIDDNVPITLAFNGIKSVVAPNLKELLIHQLSHLECYEHNRMSFTDNDKRNRVMMVKKEFNKEMETFIYGLVPDTKSTDRSVKFVNADGVSLTVSCKDSFSTLTGFVQQGDKKESIDNLLTFKSLDGYRCGLKLPLVLQTNSIKFDFDAKPLDFSFSSTSGSSINKPNIKFHSDKNGAPSDLSTIDWETFDPEDK
uniref:CUB domain-containing protein n=1 Tax=Tetranychus urticae TaxID=32264 RepID=T1KZE8_TETUR